MIKVSKPALIINEKICRNNILKMKLKAASSEVAFRPHFKTHQNIIVGSWFKEEGITKIAVSSVSMALKFANKGWDDILIAFPFNVHEAEEINNLASRIKLGLTVSCPESTLLLKKSIKSKVSVYIKIEVGSKRTGFPAGNKEEIAQTINILAESNNLLFKGFMAHAGHTYTASNHDEIRSVYRVNSDVLKKLKKTFSTENSTPIISWGDTPSCSIIPDFEGVDEVRPGNFVYYDLMQLQIGACNQENIAAVVACPVVAKHPERLEVVIYGGAVHFSKENLLCKTNIPYYGEMVSLNDDGKWKFFDEKYYLRRLSQEHGIIQLPENIFNNVKVGSIVGIAPVHSCLTADLIKDCIFV